MAISECDEYIEVRIKRPPADSLSTYFDEYVDPNVLGRSNNKVCESYIVVGEHDVQYLIEVILKPGFKRYCANSLQVEIWLGSMPCQHAIWHLPPIGQRGLENEKIFLISSCTVEEKGVNTAKNIAFCRLETDSGLERETPFLGMDPTALGTIRIEIRRFNSIWDDYSYGARKSPSRETGLLDDKQKPPKIDEILTKPENGGITHSTRFLEEGSQPISPTVPELGSHVAAPRDKVGLVEFVFKYRTQGILETLGIVKKPPPLWEWAWDDLRTTERPLVFKRLQKDNKVYEMKEWEMKLRTGVEDQEPPEWNAYSKILNHDRKRLFEILQEKNKAYTRRDGRRDVKLSVKQLEYEQGPEGWEKHGDTHAISAKKQEPIVDVGKGSSEIGPSAPLKAPKQTQTPTANHAAAADPFSTIPAKVLGELKPSNIGQNMKVQERSTFRGPCQPVKDERHVKAEGLDATSMNDIPPQGADTHSQAEQASTSQTANVQKSKRLREEVESIVKNKLVVKSENSTTAIGGPIQDQSPHSKRRKISDTLTHAVEPDQRLKLFSTTIDITGDVPIVEPKAAITIDLTAESSSLVKTEKPDSSSNIIPAGQSQSETSRATRTVDRSTNAKSGPSHSIDDHGTVLGPVKPEPTNPSDITVDGLEQPGFSSVKRVRPTPTEAAERGECSIQ